MHVVLQGNAPDAMDVEDFEPPFTQEQGKEASEGGWGTGEKRKSESPDANASSKRPRDSKGAAEVGGLHGPHDSQVWRVYVHAIDTSRHMPCCKS
jgi:hypothetical protein